MPAEQQNGPAAGWTWADPAPPPTQPTGPRGSERTRVDTNILGIDHDAVNHRIANWASTLPEAWRKPAAILATLPADILMSAAEMLSSPESVATMGASRATAAVDGVAATREGVRDLADAVIKKKLVDPDAIELAAERMKLQAARSRTRQAKIRNEIAAQTRTTPAAAPAETAVAETAPPAPAPAPAAPAASLPAERALKILIDAGLNPSEADQALKWLRAGVPLETVQQRILSSQAFASKVPGVASDAEVHGVIVHRRPRGPQPE